MRTLVTALCLLTTGAFIATEFSPEQAEARSRKRKGKRVKKAKAPVATKQTHLGIGKLMGKFKWGMTRDEVLRVLEQQIRDHDEPILRKISDPLQQDRRRKEMMEKVRKVRKDYVTFAGKQTPWDVSLVDKEFAHKNNESMALVWKKRERRFFFFYHERLWKIFIAFNAENFADKTFEDFAKAMEARFGPAARKFSVSVSGDSKMDHLAWPKAGQTKLLAYDYTGFYGNFCMSLVNVDTWNRVREGRKLNSPRRSYSDPLVDAVTRPSGSDRDQNEDIIDRITGKGSDVPVRGDGEAASPVPPSSSTPGASRPGYSPPKKHNKKINPDNPLQGLDL